jgi:hypothetical protein
MLSGSVAFASDSRSSNFVFQESSLGGVGQYGSASANYQSADAAGILGLGNSASTNFQLNAGNITTGDPALAFSVDTSAVSFGQFSAATAATATSTFQVLNYTSFGYVVQIIGNAPTSATGHTISAMSTTGPSQAGTEQYGINLVANTSPVSLGTNPDQGQFGFGNASSNYATANNYRYVSGETIAQAPKSSGVTTYTISYIVNVNSLTPGGEYTSNQILLCTGTY